ncbi:hypothetical protein HDV05_003992 [Chytridiales sp. JEL 0842]|nr:hypothetical protein HDV05_003992 [Chytridiales sp. JEL 0842]
MTTPAPAAKQNAPSVHEDVVHPHDSHAAKNPTRVIAIAVDSSPYSEYALKWALENVIRSETDQIILLNVRPLASVPTLYSSIYIDNADSYEKLESAHKQQSHDLLRALATAHLPPWKFSVRGIALRGDPRDELVYKCEELGANILIVGSRGLGSFKRAMLGSVSDYLVHNLKCPVVVVRPPSDDALPKKH